MRSRASMMEPTCGQLVTLVADGAEVAVEDGEAAAVEDGAAADEEDSVAAAEAVAIVLDMEAAAAAIPSAAAATAVLVHRPQLRLRPAAGDVNLSNLLDFE